MKKLLFLAPVVVLIAAGCSQQATVQQNMQTGNETVQPNDQSLSPSPTSTSNGMKAYSNTTLGFSIQYPQNWSVDQQRSSANEVVFDNGRPESHISVSVQPYSKTVNDWEKSLDQSVITKTKNITIAGQSGIEVYSGEVGGLAGQSAIVYKGSLYLFQEVDSMPSEMLASFKFTE